jgi:hypothetical protein
MGLAAVGAVNIARGHDQPASRIEGMKNLQVIRVGVPGRPFALDSRRFFPRRRPDEVHLAFLLVPPILDMAGLQAGLRTRGSGLTIHYYAFPSLITRRLQLHQTGDPEWAGLAASLLGVILGRETYEKIVRS